MFSLTEIKKEEWKLHGYDKAIWPTKGSSKVMLDIVINTPRGSLLCACFKRNSEKLAADIDFTNTKISIQLAHYIVGHMDGECTRLSEKVLGYELTRGKVKPCEACAAGKSEQINVTKSSDYVKIFLDISTIKIPKDIKVSVTKLSWRIMVD